MPMGNSQWREWRRHWRSTAATDEGGQNGGPTGDVAEVTHSLGWRQSIASRQRLMNGFVEWIIEDGGMEFTHF